MLEARAPVLLFDGDCGFCTTCARLAQRRIDPEAEIVAWQLADLEGLGVTEEDASEAVQWVEEDGTVRSGHEAVAALFRDGGPIWRPIGRLLVLPGISPLAAWGYRLVAANRHRLPGGQPACRR
ncbi:MAG TPA: DUF393 domain-containing protein [Solirubrobacterales bacterium]|jgi:predicted DCC family thiol-disulfide oxidoreductase YuxK